MATVTKLSPLTNDELLNLRFCELDLSLEPLAPAINQLGEELSLKQINFIPSCFLADEWFVPTDATNIGIPFYLVHPRLIKLEEDMMADVEGGTLDECMRILRHEAGHAIAHAYGLTKTKAYQKVFGKPSEETPDSYRPRFYSKNYVRNLDNFYAQCDPDEDFAETFAVWLNPSSNYKKHYSRWGALKKLECVESLMAGITGTPPLTTRTEYNYSIQKLKTRLKNHYIKKRRDYAEDYPDFFDQDLKKIFTADKKEGSKKASVFISRHKKEMMTKVSLWSGEKKYSLDQLIHNLQARANTLGLLVYKTETETLIDLVSLLTSMAVSRRLTGKLKQRV
ncbi:putative zinc-binding metallopeptidase [bacterium]|nr:putative zinc-binding metallopeptidase [bacterium]